MPVDFQLLTSPDVPPILAVRAGAGYEWLLFQPTEISGTAQATIGGVTATIAGTPTVHATAQATIGPVTATITGDVTTPGAGLLVATIGPVTATIIGLPTVHGTFVATIGPVTATISGLPVVSGAFVATIGPATATIIGVLLLPVRQTRIITAADILDGKVPQVHATVRWELLDAQLQHLGYLHPVRRVLQGGAQASSPSIDANTEATFARALRGLTLIPSEAAGIDTFGSRIKPWWVVETSTGEEQFEMGVFMFQARDLHLRTWGGLTDCPLLVDQTWMLAQGRSSSFSIPVGGLLSDNLRTLAAEAGILDLTGIENSDIVATTNIWWLAGTTRLEMMKQLCALLAFHPPYFDNQGKLICRSVPNLDLATPDHRYPLGEHSRVKADSIVMSDDAWDAPNVYLVVNTSATDTPIAGRYEIPSDAPNSVLHRGFEVVRVINEPGVQDDDQATALAKAAYAQNPRAYQWAEYDAIPDPRHDLFAIVELDGVNYREPAWNLVCEPEGPHHHSLRRIFSVAS